MRELVEALFESEGVLGRDEELPKFSLSEERMGLSHKDWFNSVLSRLIAYGHNMQRKKGGKQPTVKGFSQQKIYRGDNSVSSFTRLSGRVAKAAGLTGEYKTGIHSIEPRLLTDFGAQVLVQRWRQAIDESQERQRDQKESDLLLGRLVRENGYVLLDADQMKMYWPDQVIAKHDQES